MSGANVVVIGGGVIGCAVARRVARDGARTVIVERDQPGLQSSWAAAGMLAPMTEAEGPGAHLELLRASGALYPTFAAELRAETGIDVEYRAEGTLLVALTEADADVLETRRRWQAAAGHRVEAVTARAALRMEPLLAPDLRSALFLPEDRQVDNRLLMGALVRAASEAGVEMKTGVAARSLEVERGRAVGVRLASGEIIRGDWVVIAAGSWAAEIAGLPRPLPVVPVHGQLLALQAVPPGLTHVIHSPTVYLVPRRGGRIIVGATVERVGFRRAVTAGGVLSLLAPAVDVAPGLRDAPLIEFWSGFRPGTPDGLPILGRDPDVEGLLYATGHYRNGILLAPITAELLAAELRGDRSHDLTPFEISRFGG